MQKGERLADELAELDRLLGGTEGGPAQLRGAARRLDRIAEDHPLLAEALAAIDRAVIEASEGEEALARARRRCASIPPNSKTPRRACSTCARSPASTASRLGPRRPARDADRAARCARQGAIGLEGLEDAAEGAVATIGPLPRR